MRTRYVSIAMALIVGCMGGAAAYAQTPDPSLLAQAKIERADAEKTALKRVPGGVIKEGELEREHGKLIWSFDIQKPKSRNITEVQVNAITGKVVSVATEKPADQAKEAAAEKAEAEKAKSDKKP